MEMLEHFKSFFDYHDGELYRKVNVCNQSSGIKVGWNHVSNGKTYKRMSYNYKFYYVHQLIYFYHHGYIPKFVDHIDMNPLNNKIENLREVTQMQNTQNRRKSKSNTSGYKGVTYNKAGCNWTAAITFNYKRKFLGNYETPELAYQAYQKAAGTYHSHNPEAI